MPTAAPPWATAARKARHARPALGLKGVGKGAGLSMQVCGWEAHVLQKSARAAVDEVERRPHPFMQREGSTAIPLWEFSVASCFLRTALGLEESLLPPRSLHRLHVESLPLDCGRDSFAQA